MNLTSLLFALLALFALFALVESKTIRGRTRPILQQKLILETPGIIEFCAPGCLIDWTVDEVCDPECKNPACNWDGGACNGISP